MSTPLVVDACIWVAAADASDSYYRVSRAWLSQVGAARVPLVVAASTKVEVACALARRMRHPERGRLLADSVLDPAVLTIVPFDNGLLAEAIAIGTELFLRAGDAIHAAVAARTDGRLLSWDTELIHRAGAMTPEQWLDENR
ncbi:MAG: type II toxin-antitoxin system VapC family toxin [Gemmatimonadales bacterium]